MTVQEIKNKYDKINLLLNNKSIFEAIELIKLFCNELSISKFNDAVENLETSYKYMVKYMSEGINDPNRNDVYSKLLLSLYKLNDNIARSGYVDINISLYYNTLRFIQNSKYILPSSIAQYNKCRSELTILELVPEIEQDKSQIATIKKESEELEADIFKMIWTSAPNDIEYTEYAKNIIMDSNMPLHFRQLAVNALAMSCTEFFDENKVNTIVDIYENSDSVELQSMAITVLYILSYKHKVKFKLSAKILDRVSLLHDNIHFESDIKTVILQMIKAKDTERITKKMQNELLPELMKLNPKIYSKIKGLDKNTLEEEFEANPDWQNILEDSNITKKIQEMNEIQLEGGDVFMSTFSHLKNFPFFNNISNWFLPFHNNHSIVGSSGINTNIFAIIEKSSFLCNSDKYSFALAMTNVSQTQKEMMASQFKSQNIDLKELNSAELTTKEKTRENYILRYVQDLYRFFKLYPRKNEFYDPFGDNYSINDNFLTKFIFSDMEIMNIIAEFYFKRGYYSDAIDILTVITTTEGLKSELFQKLGFCYQNIRDYHSAIEQYKKADIIETQNVWTYRHLAICYKAIGNNEEAIKYYKYAELLTPENINTLLNIGHLLLDKNEITEALKYYYKVDYLSGNSNKAWRPIAWCEFLNKNYKQSENYYSKVENNSPSPQDYLNMGHLALAQQDNAKAMKYYLLSYKKCENIAEDFKTIFLNDKNILIEQGINQDEIPIIIDAIKYNNQ